MGRLFIAQSRKKDTQQLNGMIEIKEICIIKLKKDKKKPGKNQCCCCVTDPILRL